MAVHGSFLEGLVEYLPIQCSPEPLQGHKSFFINCVWVVPPFWRTGVATALVEKTIKKAEAYGGLSVLAYDGDKWFSFKEVDRDGTRVLLHMDLCGGEQPRLVRPKVGRAKKNGKTVVELFFNSQCPWSGWMVDKVKWGLKKYNAIVSLINTDDRRTVEKYGMSRGVRINGVPLVKRMASWRELEAIIKQTQHRR